MNSKLMFSLVCSAVLFASGCNTNPHTYNDANQPAVHATADQKHTDAKILSSLIVLNKNELAAANAAEQKSANRAVRNYAETMTKTHSRNLQDAERLSQTMDVAPKQGQTASLLQRKGRQQLVSLNRLQNQAFDRAYINAMVKDHTAALQLLDQRLIPQATNPQLRQYLEATRANVAQHLRQAQAVQGQLANS